MLQTQVNYWNLVENKRHNIASEEAASKQAEAALRQAAASEEQARIGWANANTNMLNAQTNARNADTNLFNAQVNAQLGAGNLEVAQTLAGSTVSLNAATAALTGQKTKTEKWLTEQENIRTNSLPLTLTSNIEKTKADTGLSLQKTTESQHSIMQGWVSTVSGAIKDIGNLVTGGKGLTSLVPKGTSLVENIKSLK